MRQRNIDGRAAVCQQATCLSLESRPTQDREREAPDSNVQRLVSHNGDSAAAAADDASRSRVGG